MKKLRIAGFVLLIIGLIDVAYWFLRAYPIYIEELGYFSLSFFTVPIVTFGLVAAIFGVLCVSVPDHKRGEDHHK